MDRGPHRPRVFAANLGLVDAAGRVAVVVVGEVTAQGGKRLALAQSRGDGGSLLEPLRVRPALVLVPADRDVDRGADAGRVACLDLLQ